MNVNDIAMAYGSAINKAWSDHAFKTHLTSDPKSALKSLGFELPSDVEVEVLEGSAKKVYIALPPQPGQMSMGELDAVAGGNAVSDRVTAGVQNAAANVRAHPSQVPDRSQTSAWFGSNSASSVTDPDL